VGIHTPPGFDRTQPLLLHWDGRDWHPIPGPLAESVGYQLNTVVALTADNIWAGGQDLRTLLLHWDGQQWTRVPIALSREVYAMTAVGSRALWAVGGGGSDGSVQFTLHWDGQQWQQIATEHQPPPEGGYGKVGDNLRGVAAVAANDMWAIGDLGVGGAGQYPVVEHWDGQRWKLVATPLDTARQVPDAVAASPDGTVWIAADSGNGQYNQAVMWRRTSGSCPPEPVPGTNTRYFAESGHTIAGLFLDYWQAHGGLTQQGYPLSEVVGQVAPTDGKQYSMQYFERAVFEYHPENPPPYKVLLSLLGVAAYQQRYGPVGAPNQHPGTDHLRFFAETGHSVGGKFRAYWESHGGLAQQGYPISDEFTEISALDGRPYTVQYFQRAVFELHPEHAGTPYEVLLSQLGTVRARQLGQAAP
jgi:hypothetical protein